MERECDNCKYRDVYYKAPPCNECNGYQNWESDAMTNADRIRAMSDEELAKFFHDMIQDCGCNNVPCQQFCKAARNCELAWLNWLKKEARTND